MMTVMHDYCPGWHTRLSNQDGCYRALKTSQRHDLQAKQAKEPRRAKDKWYRSEPESIWSIAQIKPWQRPCHTE